MPTYSYACTACDHRFDAQQSFTDEALVECPECRGRLRKLFTGVGVVFKGSGFYRTDSRAGQKSGGSGGTSTSTAGSSGSGSTASTGSSGSGSSSASSSSSSSGGSTSSAASA